MISDLDETWQLCLKHHQKRLSKISLRSNGGIAGKKNTKFQDRKPSGLMNANKTISDLAESLQTNLKYHQTVSYKNSH